MSSDNRNVALFSIPGCVTFPYTHMPLHVFEPRYRDMVNHCISNDMMMGVCHTHKVLHEKKASQSLKETLNSNQSTYKPQSVFSVGDVELLDTLPDGRLHVVVHMQERVQLEQEVQTLPFSIVEVSSLADLEFENQKHDTAQLKEKILTRLKALFAANTELMAYFDSAEIQDMNEDMFSYHIFSVLQFDPDMQQQILEIRSGVQRLELLLDILNSQ